MNGSVAFGKNYFAGSRMEIFETGLEHSRRPFDAAIAQWVCLYLPSYRPGFESQTHHLCFFNIYLNCVIWKRRKYTKRGWEWLILKQNYRSPPLWISLVEGDEQRTNMCGM